MRRLLILLLALLVAGMAGLWLWRRADLGADAREMRRLRALQPEAPPLFDPAMVDGLPAPARRYLLYAIRPGTPLYTVAEIEMTGRFGLGTRAAPRYLPMRAHQVLAPLDGFVWSMQAGAGLMQVSGSDSSQWSRFWLAGLLPVARAEADADFSRSAFGRLVSEAVFWSPASLLPGENVRWEAVDDARARVTIDYGDLQQTIEITVAEDGRATQVVFARWSNANPEKRFQLQPFGGTLSDYAEVDGFRVPMRVEAGNFFGTPDYFPFFIAQVRSIRFPRDGAS